MGKCYLFYFSICTYLCKRWSYRERKEGTREISSRFSALSFPFHIRDFSKSVLSLVHCMIIEQYAAQTFSFCFRLKISGDYGPASQIDRMLPLISERPFPLPIPTHCAVTGVVSIGSLFMDEGVFEMKATAHRSINHLCAAFVFCKLIEELLRTRTGINITASALTPFKQSHATGWF